MFKALIIVDAHICLPRKRAKQMIILPMVFFCLWRHFVDWQFLIMACVGCYCRTSLEKISPTFHVMEVATWCQTGAKKPRPTSQSETKKPRPTNQSETGSLDRKSEVVIHVHVWLTQTYNSQLGQREGWLWKVKVKPRDKIGVDFCSLLLRFLPDNMLILEEAQRY